MDEASSRDSQLEPDEKLMETMEERNWNQQRFHPLHERLVTLEAAEVERDSDAIGEEWLWDRENYATRSNANGL